MRYKMATMEGGAAGRQMAGMQLPESAIEEIRRYYGFDKPVHVRYVEWLGNVVRLDLGNSYIYQEPVWDVIKSPVPGVALPRTDRVSPQLLHLRAARRAEGHQAPKPLRLHLERRSSSSATRCRVGAWHGPPGAVRRRQLLERLPARRVPARQLGVPEHGTEDVPTGLAHGPAGVLLHDRRLRDTDDPDEELAPREHGAGLRADRLREGTAQAARHFRARAAQLVDPASRPAWDMCSA